jgi:UDP-glucose:(heptosyl)LPS alpha-1,3-glucosyltransferase
MTSANKSIALVYRYVAGLSGVPGIMLDHARYLSALGYEVGLIGEKLDRARIAQTGAAAIRVGRWPLPKLKSLKRFAHRADYLAKKYQFVAGHGHNFNQNVLHLHNCLRLAYEKSHGHEMQVADAPTLLQESMLQQGGFEFCVANSRLMQQELIRRYRIAADKIVIIYPGYDIAKFNLAGRYIYRNATRAQLGIDDATIVVGLITSGDFRKRGVDIAIQAFAQLPENVRKLTKLLVVGKQADLKTYRQLVDTHNLSGMVHFLPPIPDVERYYHALDLCIHPARFEEFGMSVQEAMACGLPVIASTQVGAMELLPADAYASLPSVMDVAQLSERLEALIRDQRLRQQWSEYSSHAAKQNSTEKNFSRTLALYRQAGL